MKIFGSQTGFRQCLYLSSLCRYTNGVIYGYSTPVEQVQSQLSHQFRHKSTHTLKIGENRQIAYRQMPGQSQPTIVMVPGFHSYAHMNGMTAKSILR